jgi:L-ascorbate metabolism protein UlaG (beta-lactamase superfamily)
MWPATTITGSAQKEAASRSDGPYLGIDTGLSIFRFQKFGACDVTWPDIHMTPEEAVQAHADIRGKLLMPVHWGTFNLAFHAWNDPPERVLLPANRANAALVVPRPGELVEAALITAESSRLPIDPWWR